MRSYNKLVLLTELSLLIYIIFINTIAFKYISKFVNYITIFFLLILLIILIINYGIPRNKNYYKNKCLNTIIIILLLYLIIIYLLGLVVGFNKTFYQRNLISIIKNVFKRSSFIILIEAIRYLMFMRKPSKIELIILIIELIIIYLTFDLQGIIFKNYKELFIGVTTIIIPSILGQLLISYISYNIGLLEVLVYQLSISNFIYIVPFIPTLGDYLIALLGVVLPFTIYKYLNNILRYKEKYSYYLKSTVKKVIKYLIIIVNIILIILISGIFNYQIIAIASGSMEPVYYRGDAVIFKKEKISNIKKGDILVYKTDKGIVTHRVVDINILNNEYIFRTKGDNNSFYDDKVSSNNVIGVVKLVIKYIGYPTIIVNEYLNS